MKEYKVRCVCGKGTWVLATDAGRTKPCPCGKIIDIPPLSALRRSAQEEPPSTEEERPPINDNSMSWVGAGIVFGGVFLSVIIKMSIGQSGRVTPEDSLIVLVLQVVTGVVGCSIFAKSKGLPVLVGVGLGFLGCIGLIVLFFLPVNDSPDRPRR